MPDESQSTVGILSNAYEAYSSMLFQHCRYHISDTEIAQELVQDAFVRTWEYLQQGKKVENMKTFLYRVLNNLIVDYVRKRKRQDEVSLDELQERGFDPGKDETDVLHRQIDFWKTMAELKKSEDYDLLVLRYVNGLRPTDIATAKGVAPNTIAVKIHRIVKNLTHKLKMKKRRRAGSAAKASMH